MRGKVGDVVATGVPERRWRATATHHLDWMYNHAGNRPMVDIQCLRTWEGRDHGIPCSRRASSSMDLMRLFQGLLAMVRAFPGERRRAARYDEVVTNERRLRHLVDNLPGYVFVRETLPDGRLGYSYLSAGITDLLGYRPDEVMADPSLLRGLLHPDDLPRYQAVTEAAGAAMTMADVVVRVHHREGQWRWLHTRARPRRQTDGSLAWDGMVLDVTDRVQAEKLLERSELRFQAIFDSTFQFTGLLDPWGTLVEINRTMLDFAGVGRGAVVGRPLWETPWWQLEAQAHEELHAAIIRAAAGELVRYDAQVQGAGGHRLTIDFSLKPIRDAGGKVMLIVIEGRDITERKRLEAEISYLAMHDSLTGLANRTMFHQELRRVCEKPLHSGDQLALMLIDLDRFKTVNDAYGHQIGDRLLVEVGQRLRACLRPADLPARLGGDEFAVLARSRTGSDDLTHLAQRIVTSVGSPAHMEGLELSSSLSLGMVLSPGEPRIADELIAKADQALYAAKRAGRGCWRLFGADHPDRAQDDLELPGELRSCGDEG